MRAILPLMSKLDELEALAKEVSASTITILPKRCSYIRNWNSKCKACMNACPHDAISRSIGRFTIDPDLCTNCGACTAACPTSALLTGSPTATDIVRSARRTAQAYGGIAAFMCQRDAQELDIDENRVTVLPCLNYLDEYLICGLLALGIDRVALLSRGCDGCPVGGSEPYFPAVVKSARSLVRTWNAPGKVKIFHDIPESLCNSGGRARAAKSDRREALEHAGGSAMGYVADTVDELITGKKRERVEEDRQVIVKPSDVFPADSYRGPRIKGMLDRVGELPAGASIESRFWASVDLDPTACHYCGCCATMCATRALTYTQDLPENPTRVQRKQAPGTLTFTPSLCMACGLCQDSCFRRALVVGNRIPASYLDPNMVVTLYEDEKQVSRSKFGF